MNPQNLVKLVREFNEGSQCQKIRSDCPSILKHSDVLSWSTTAQDIWGKQLVKLKYRWPFESVWGVTTRLQHFRQFRTYLSEAMQMKCMFVNFSIIWRNSQHIMAYYVIAYHTRVIKATKNTRSSHYFD